MLRLQHAVYKKSNYPQLFYIWTAAIEIPSCTLNALLQLEREWGGWSWCGDCVSNWDPTKDSRMGVCTIHLVRGETEREERERWCYNYSVYGEPTFLHLWAPRSCNKILQYASEVGAATLGPSFCLLKLLKPAIKGAPPLQNIHIYICFKNSSLI